MATADMTEILRCHPTSLRELIPPELETLVHILGAPALTTPAKEEGSALTHLFILPLWPHLFWAVDQQHEGYLWDARFCNQHAWGEGGMDPSLIRRGVWTKESLDRIADRWDFCSGWDEAETRRFHFSSAIFEGDLVFGLLQNWWQVQ